MLGREYRITEAHDFKQVQEQGDTYRYLLFTVGVLDRKDAQPSRFGFVLPTKVYKNATDRNKIKRILSESIRHQLIFVKNGFDVVFIPKDSILRAYTTDVVAAVKVVFDEADLLK